MMDTIFIKLVITLIYGIILGIETETREIEKIGKKKAKENESSRIGGVRTYTIISLLGGIGGIFYAQGDEIIAYLLICLLAGFLGLAYYLNVKLKQAFGLTTEVAILITFLLGFSTTASLVPLSVNIFIIVILAFLMSHKRGIGKLIANIEHSEVNDIIKFGVLALVILPLLPNQTYSIGEILSGIEIDANRLGSDITDIQVLNPFSLWLIVVVISGINLFGQILKKTIGEKGGILITGVIGGIISSTSTAVALAHTSVSSKTISPRVLAGTAVIANALSLPAVLILLFAVQANFVEEVILPFLAMTALGTSIGTYLILSSKQPKAKSIHISYEPFAISPALQFVGFVMSITILIQFITLIGNDSFTTFFTSLSGVVGMDAPTIAINQVEQAGEIAKELAVTIFLATNFINFCAKAGFALYYGSKDFYRPFIAGLIFTFLGTLVVLL